MANTGVTTGEHDGARAALARLLDVMARLRDPVDGCPWDVEQTFATIAPYTIEEAYEVADAIARNDMDELREELGDLLLQVVYHARMAQEAGAFDFAGVAATIADKMVARHPHVFGDGEVASASAQTRVWEDHKAGERAAKAGRDGRAASALDNVPLALPGLTRAEKLQRRAARVGFDWPEAIQVLDKIEEEIAELRAELSANGGPARIEDEVGDLLFCLANLARHLEIDAETALRRCNAKFERRFRAIEAMLAAQGRRAADLPLDELETYWLKAKASETDIRSGADIRPGADDRLVVGEQVDEA